MKDRPRGGLFVSRDAVGSPGPRPHGRRRDDQHGRSRLRDECHDRHAPIPRQLTQQKAALVEQSAAAAESLKDQAASLSHAVSTFKMA
jgi:hypothetical protein